MNKQDMVKEKALRNLLTDLRSFNMAEMDARDIGEYITLAGDAVDYLLLHRMEQFIYIAYLEGALEAMGYDLVDDDEHQAEMTQ